MEFQIGTHTVGAGHPTYFIADIAANHDGDLERAKLLIRLAKDAGADAGPLRRGLDPDPGGKPRRRPDPAQATHRPGPATAPRDPGAAAASGGPARDRDPADRPATPL